MASSVLPVTVAASESVEVNCGGGSVRSTDAERLDADILTAAEDVVLDVELIYTAWDVDVRSLVQPWKG